MEEREGMQAPMMGIGQWFPFEERELVQRAVAALTELRAPELRTLFSWADWCRPDGPAWFDWFIGRLAAVPDLTLLPCLFYTPPSLARTDMHGKQKTSYPPEDLSQYGAFVGEMIERYGSQFEWIQLWNEPNWTVYWSWDLDPYGDLFADMAKDAAETAHQLGKKVLLGGTTPLDYPWFGRMAEQGLLAHCDAVAFHYSPSWPDNHRHWQPFDTELRTLRALLRGLNESADVWIGEIGLSTKVKEGAQEEELERQQVAYFESVRALPVSRVYWHSLFDAQDDATTDDAINADMEADPTANHFGLISWEGRRKPLFDHWKKRNTSV